MREERYATRQDQNLSLIHIFFNTAERGGGAAASVVFVIVVLGAFGKALGEAPVKEREEEFPMQVRRCV